jgi:hypothetical protein
MLSLRLPPTPQSVLHTPDPSAVTPEPASTAVRDVNSLRLGERDIQQIAKFVREFVSTCLVPWMEKCVVDWNENVRLSSCHSVHALIPSYLSLLPRDVYLPVSFLQLVACLALGQRRQCPCKLLLRPFPRGHLQSQPSFPEGILQANREGWQNLPLY